MERGISNASLWGNYHLIWEDIKNYTLAAFYSLIVNFNVVAASISLSPQNFTPIPHRIAFGILQLSKTTTFCLFEVYIINAKSACSPFVSDLSRLTNEILGGFLQVHLAGQGPSGCLDITCHMGLSPQVSLRGLTILEDLQPLTFHLKVIISTMVPPHNAHTIWPLTRDWLARAWCLNIRNCFFSSLTLHQLGHSEI